MLTVPKACAILMTTVAPVFTTRVGQPVQVLLVGAMLAPGKRTVTAALRVMGLAQAQVVQPSPRVLNRAVWSSLEGARLVLVLLGSILAPAGPLIRGLEDPLERRRGAPLQATGMYRAAVRSAHSHRVQASGWRWLRLMRWVSSPWAKRVWALPFLTVLAPSERDHPARGQRHKPLTDGARQMFLVVRRWRPERSLGVVTASRVAVSTLLWRVRPLPNPSGCLTRVRLDAALYEPAPPREPRQTGRPRLQGQRRPTGAHALRDAAPGGTTVRVRRWYRAVARKVASASATGVG
jgi:hypothetical protein